MSFPQFLALLSALAYTALAGVSIANYVRQRTRGAMYFAAAFGSIAGIAVVATGFDIAGSDLIDVGGDWAIKALIVVIVVFPYLLFRFTAEFEPASKIVERSAGASTLVVGAWTFALPAFPEVGEVAAPSIRAWSLAFAVQWIVLLGVVALRLWRGGVGQPTVSRRRMRLLALGSMMMMVSIAFSIGSGFGEPAQDPDTVDAKTVVADFLGVSVYALFLLGYLTPRILRVAWRQKEEHQLYLASLELMRAETRNDVTDVILPRAAELIGARGVELRGNDHELIGTHGAEVPADPDDDPSGDVVAVSIQSGELRVLTSPYAPFFGVEEIRLMERLGALADLAIDRTDLLGVEREVRAELEEASAELESFVYSSSHDLKSPLIALLGYLEVLHDEIDTSDEQVAFYMERMRQNGEFMQSLINDLLELSRVGRMNTDPEPVLTTQLVSSIAADLGSRYPSITVEAADLPDLFINPVRARQLLMNLIENAANHGGRDDLTIRVSAQRVAGGGLEISVADNGHGIEPKYRERIFGVFERLAPDDTGPRGTGIGLAICRKVVESREGQIWVEESADGGADFRITLPHTSVASEMIAEPELVEATI